MNAYVAVVFARYMMLSFINRMEKDARTMEILFFNVCDELSDITLFEALSLLMQVFVTHFSEKLVLNETEVMKLLETFMENLPASLQNMLFQRAKAA